MRRSVLWGVSIAVAVIIAAIIIVIIILKTRPKKDEPVADEPVTDTTIGDAAATELTEYDWTVIATINENSDLGVTFMEKLASDPELQEAMGEFGYDVDSGDVNVDVWGFHVPVDGPDIYLNQVCIRGGEHHVLGICLGDTLEDAARVLENYGFTAGNELDYGSCKSVYYNNGNVYVLITIEEDVITTLQVGCQVN